MALRRSATPTPSAGFCSMTSTRNSRRCSRRNRMISSVDHPIFGVMPSQAARWWRRSCNCCAVARIERSEIWGRIDVMVPDVASLRPGYPSPQEADLRPSACLQRVAHMGGTGLPRRWTGRGCCRAARRSRGRGDGGPVRRGAARCRKYCRRRSASPSPGNVRGADGWWPVTGLTAPARFCHQPAPSLSMSSWTAIRN